MPAIASRGFSLLEVLVTVVILSVGLLGMAGLQLNAMKFNQAASVRTHAAVLAYDIADRMRANRALARAGGYSVTLDSSSGGTGIVSADLESWKAELSSSLPNGNGAIQTVGDVTTITVQWDESRINGNQVQQFEFETRI